MQTPKPGSSPAGSVVTGRAAGLVVRVVGRASGRMVAVNQASTSNGALIVQTASTGAVAQWRLVSADGGCYQLLNVHSGLALDNPDGTSADGVQMQQWQAVAGDANQIWCFQAVGGGWYSIRNQASGSLLDVRDGVSQEDSAIQQWSADQLAPNANQTWQLQAVG